jgi:hypothetical protein
MPKVINNEENMKKCICPECPTFRSSSCPSENGENFFCARGKTACELTDKSCICGMCPLWDEFNLSMGYFCLNGAAE